MRRDRPETDPRYGIPADDADLLPWSFVAETMQAAKTYWLATTRPDGEPHARPVWGVWVDDAVHCGGGDGTRWARNLAANPAVTVHTESGTDVVIVEGTADRLDDATADPDTLARLDAAYEKKYDVEHGPPFFAVRPRRVLAWTDYPRDATRFTFADVEPP